LVFVGLLVGLVALAEEAARIQPHVWRAAHNSWLLAGVWLPAMAAALRLLALTPTQQVALCWALLTTVYAFATAILVQATAGIRALGPDGSLLGWIAFIANAVTVGSGLFASLLPLMGAAAAVKHGPDL
jgi:hypothetical protein